MSDTELIEEIFRRAEQSDLFCVRLIKACREFIAKLEEEN